MKLLRIIYTLWGLFWFWAIFILLYPGFLVVIHVKSLREYTCELNRIWAHVVYWACFMPVKVEWRFKAKREDVYIYCPNHNSFLDIPLVAHAIPHFIAFMGKKDLEKVPLFGYMFKKIHIPVDRGSLKSRYKAFEDTKAAIDKGWSVLLFPEGGINDHPPKPRKFKEGAFKIAIEKQVPIIPVTIPYHWIVLHDTHSWMKWHPAKIIYHEPIETTGMTLEDAPKLKQMTYQVIHDEMKAHFPEEFDDKAAEEVVTEN